MLCFLCGKEIGWLRSMVDRQYCCTEHRREARLASAQVLREEDDEHEIWSVSRSKTKQVRSGNHSSQTPLAVFLALGTLLIAVLMLPGTGSAPGVMYPSASLEPPRRDGLFARTTYALGDFLRQRAPVTLHHDFTEGLRGWTTVALNSAGKIDDPHDWKTPSPPSIVMPGSLRIWDRSKSLHNYQMEFEAQIERRSLSWAFRASDTRNFYASKIQITRPGPQPNADLIRYIMLNGQELDRVRLPLPVTLERGGDYHIRVSVQDSRFVTYLNGQVISSWTDQRLARGGVGFFSDDDDEQKVAWVSVSERDSFLGRMLSQFGLFVLPGAPAR